MRLHRIRLRHFRGVAERELELPDSGVVIVEGPNESGKSSLAEALWLVFDLYDSSRSRRITDIQPVDRDVGVEVEVEVSTGPYRFVYFKRFLKRPETVLRLLEPRRETLKGRQAHERALRILDETIDRHLWAALRLVQGEQVGQAELHDKQGLAQALDRAAGQETAGERELNLFERAEVEYGRYYTPTGRPRSPLTEAAGREEDAAGLVRTLAEELRRIEEDAERCNELAGAVGRLEKEAVEAEARAERTAAELERLLRREEEIKRLKLTLQSAQMEATVARRAVLERAGLEARHAEALRNRERLERDAAKRAPALAAAEKAETAALAALETATRRAEAARARRDVLDNDLEYHKQKLFFEQLRQRRDRVEEAQQRRSAAETELVSLAIDDEALRAVHAAEIAVVRTEAQLSSRSPRIFVKALRDGVTVDGDALAPGEHEARADDDTIVAAAGVVEVTVRPGQSIAELRTARDAARDGLRDLLDRYGVATVEDARTAHGARREAQRTLRECDASIRENLGDLTLEAIREKIERLRRWVERYPRERPGTAPPLAEDFDGTRDARTTAKQTAEAAAVNEQAARTAQEQAARNTLTLRTQRQEVDIRLRLAADAERKAAAALGTARAETPDESLAATADAAETRARAAEDSYRAEQRSLAEARPERTRERAENARRGARRALDAAQQARAERQTLSISLELRGEKGLFDALEDARTKQVRFKREHQAVQRRADAAALLFRTLADERENARRAYSQPLRRMIERLARDVFLPGSPTGSELLDAASTDQDNADRAEEFSVELDDELRVRTRTLRGRTLAFEQLSVGAREQLGLVTRLACSLLVDPDEGVPVILDDTLGHTDPDRLAGMAHALEATGRHCQVLIMTCSPERFRIPSAERIAVRSS